MNTGPLDTLETYRNATVRVGSRVLVVAVAITVSVRVGAVSQAVIVRVGVVLPAVCVRLDGTADSVLREVVVTLKEANFIGGGTTGTVVPSAQLRVTSRRDDFGRFLGVLGRRKGRVLGCLGEKRSTAGDDSKQEEALQTGDLHG